jgi:hypothetical protein
MEKGELVEMPPAQLQTSKQVMGGLVPTTLDELWRMAVMFSKSGMMPKHVERAESICVAIQMGLEVGLSPMQAVQNIAVINGRPSIWGDAALGLVQASGKLEEFNESFSGEPYTDTWTATCMAKRRGKGEPIVREFSYRDAKQAELTSKSGPWQQYPKRMLQMRARSWALRDGFADVLRGLQTREEVLDIEEIPDGSYAVAEKTREKAEGLKAKLQAEAGKVKMDPPEDDNGDGTPEDNHPKGPQKSSKKPNGEAPQGETEDETEGGKYVLWPLVKKLKSNYREAIHRAIAKGRMGEATDADLSEMKAKWVRQVPDEPWPLDEADAVPQGDDDPQAAPGPTKNKNRTTVLCPAMNDNAVVVSYCNHTGQYAEEGKGCKDREGCPVWADEDGEGDEKF